MKWRVLIMDDSFTARRDIFERLTDSNTITIVDLSKLMTDASCDSRVLYRRSTTQVQGRNSVKSEKRNEKTEASGKVQAGLSALTLEAGYATDTDTQNAKQDANNENLSIKFDHVHETTPMQPRSINE